MCPAAGQGALGIEIRAGDAVTRQHLAFLDDRSPASTTCERALLNKLGGGCQVPIGAAAELRNWPAASGRHRRESRRIKILRESRDGNDPEKLAAKYRRNPAAPRRRRHSRRSLRPWDRCAAATLTVVPTNALRVISNDLRFHRSLNSKAMKFSVRVRIPVVTKRTTTRKPAGAKRKHGQPLEGTRVLVGRARHQASSLSVELRQLGADCAGNPFH